MTNRAADTRLIILRGNSASGKSTVARMVREWYGRGMAIIGQDVVRRDILWERDEPSSVNIGMIDLMARHALDRGMHVIVEGILSRQSYGAMLTSLANDHQGTTACFYFDIPFDETVRRHATKPIATDVDDAMLRSWYRPLDLVPELGEHRIDAACSLADAVELVIAGSGLTGQELAPERGNT
jgi:predicted kinase